MHRNSDGVYEAPQGFEGFCGKVFNLKHLCIYEAPQRFLGFRLEAPCFKDTGGVRYAARATMGVSAVPPPPESWQEDRRIIF